MGALPKRRISTGRKGRRRTQDAIAKKQVKHHSVPTHKRGLVEKLTRLFVANDK